MMEEEAFLQAILAEPADEAVRLVYADWLMERGDPRGEFIAVQCQLTRWSDDFADWNAWAEAAARLPELREREKALLAKYGDVWSQPVRGLVDTFAFRRGFVEIVSLETRAFLTHAEQLFRVAPIQQVHFRYAFGTADPRPELAASPHLARLNGLDFSNYFLGDQALRQVLSSPHLQRLTTLQLKACYITDAGVRTLAASPHLAQLTTLDLSNNPLTVEGVRLLFDAQPRTQLRKLDLSGIPTLNHLQETLTASLAGTVTPALLQVLLRVLPRIEHTLTSVHALELAQRVAANPTHAVAELQRGLNASRRKVRAAAAQLVNRMGAAAAATLPALVKRFYEQDETHRRLTVRDCVALALADLLPTLPALMQTALCTLLNPLRSAEHNLREALHQAQLLSETARQALATICAQRTLWRACNAGQTTTATAASKPLVALDAASLWQAVGTLLWQAEEAAHKHLSAQKNPETARRAAREKECAWLIARLIELLQHDLQ